MSITRLEMEYYKNIGRIADALEALVAQGKQSQQNSTINKLNAASNLLYGNSKSPLKNNPGTGRSEDNYTYPQFVKKFYTPEESGMEAIDPGETHERVPNINTDLEQRMYDESQKLTGAEFQGWYNKLNSSERDAYTRVYNF